MNRIFKVVHYFRGQMLSAIAQREREHNAGVKHIANKLRQSTHYLGILQNAWLVSHSTEYQGILRNARLVSHSIECLTPHIACNM